MITTSNNALSIDDLIITDPFEIDLANRKVAACSDVIDSDSDPFLNWSIFLESTSGRHYFYPDLHIVRKTQEWETQYEQIRRRIQGLIYAGYSVEWHHALETVADAIEYFAENAAVDGMSLDEMLAQHLPVNLGVIWATTDAFSMELNGKLREPDDEPVPFLQDIYATRERGLADILFDVAVTAHHQGVAARLAAGRAKKPMSKAAKKKAAAKKARKR